MERIFKIISSMVITALMVNVFGMFTATTHVQAAVLSDLINATVSLSAAKQSFDSSEPVVVHVKISNPNRQVLQILKWQTPAEGLKAPLFFVMLNGVPLQYLGTIYKRTTPTENDYITLNPGDSLDYDVTLSDYYSFAETGDYEIVYDTASLNMYSGDGDAKIAGSMKSTELVLTIERREAPASKPGLITAIGGSTNYNSCNSGQQSALLTARANASTYAHESLDYFNAGKAGDRYVKWFGTLDVTRWGTPRSHYNSIASYVDNAAVTFDCSCTDPGVYAYVYPSDPSTIYLCSVFWYAPATGTDSKAGTLIHEMSHFYINGGTDDYVYGQSGAMSLAINSPNNAVMNADNHEYFAENNPVTIDGEIFGDVADTYWAWNKIEKLYNAGITGGCSSLPLLYCPTNTVTRAEMAVFLEKGLRGSSFFPADAPPTFSDTTGHWAEDWIEALKTDQITSGCNIGLYCPDSPVTRAQMAVFLLKAEHGSSYFPPDAASSTFGDTVGHWAEDWIEQLALEGITSGCGNGNFCPDQAVTRDQMAVFLVATFNP